MKKIFTSIFALVATTAAFAQQRTVDLSAHVVYPQAGQTIYIDSTNQAAFITAYAFINHGPDALQAGDTIVYGDNLGAQGRILGNTYAANDTFYIVDTVALGDGPASNSAFNWCVQFGAFGIDTVSPVIIDNNASNNTNCVAINLVNRNGASTGINNVNVAKNELVIFPNPANEALNFIVNGVNQEVVATVKDITGRTVATQSYGKANGTTKLSIETANLNAGLYVIEVVNNGTIYTNKFSVVK